MTFLPIRLLSLIAPAGFASIRAPACVRQRHVHKCVMPLIRQIDPPGSAILVPAALAAVALALVFLYWLSGRPGSPLDPAPFDLNAEMNLPALFSVALWIGAALVALACGRRSRAEGWRLGGYWRIMAALFLYLGIDEALMIHERSGALVSRMHEFQGAFFYAWVVAGLVFLAVVGLVFLRFLAALRPANLVLLILAAVVFVTGAVGFEMTGAVFESGGEEPGTFPLGLTWRKAIALEEGFEMLGVILLIHFLLRVLTDPRPPFRAAA